ncbi:GGDEF domain-containing protein [Kineococcus rhizosphaerae]|uniref:Diguanylate cyclase (GGDEF)-like protein n=1 Tax=Kineococcus rhizosphaerae TaxID=559628 RepID=A0A2T0QTK0_9ACTN|nr:diguanylate cyclase [Kineococcus rhizosphaerae]PRY08299.1 diguanylate cyclase (GGDEF)-like protein [Kineococcus rhizosphaerae]
MTSLAPLALLIAFAVAITTTTGLLTLRRRRATPAALPLTAALFSVSVWGLAVVLLNAGVPRPWLDRLVVPQFLGVGATVLSLRLFVDAVGGRTFRWRRALAFAVEPVLLLVAVLLDPRLHWFHTTVAYVGDPVRRSVTAGPLFWVHTAYSYMVIATAAFSIWQLRRNTTGLLRRQATTMLVAIAVPFGVNLAVVFLGDVVDVDVTPLAFTVTGVLFAYAVLQQDLLRLVPVARSLVVETVADAVFVLDARERLVDVNPAGYALLRSAGHPGGEGGEVVGRPAAGTLDPALVRAVGAGEGAAVVRLGSGRDVDVRTRWLRDDRGRPIGRVAVVRDVTEQLRAGRALEEANERLRAQVATIEGLRAELAEEAARDPLTGLRNRRRFVEDLANRLTASGASGQPLSLVLLDVDHFKAINDAHGHAVGDDVLVEVAHALRAHARPEDVVRYGGEEFVVLLPHLGAAAARVRAEELRAACARVRVEVEALRITISAGVATAPDHGTTPDELLLAADRALYEAKGGGRDQVALAD